MLNCINIEDTQRVQDLQRKSGLSDFPLRSQLRHYMTRHNGRLPELDELEGANSEPYLRKELNIKKGKSSDIKELLDKTGTQTFTDAIINLNNTYKDLEIEGHLLNKDKYYLKITHRPKIVIDGTTIISNRTHPELYVNTNIMREEIISKLSNLYGIKINEISQSQLKEQFPDMKNYQLVHGFIHNGEIYIVKDNSNVDTKLHEMLHMIFGSVKYQNPDLYYNLMNMALQIPQFEQWSKQYMDIFGKMTRNDLCEEFMVTELAKYLSGRGISKIEDTFKISPTESSIFAQSDAKGNPLISDEIKYRTMYHMNRLLDTVLMGDVSVNAIPVNKLYNYTLREVADMVNSAVATNSYKGSLEDSEINRIGSNFKSLYMNNGKLIEECE